MRISENDLTESGLGVSACAERLDMSGPVRAAVRRERDQDGRTHQRHVGDLDAPEQERQEPQPHDQLLRRKGRGAGAVVAEADVVEAHAAGREQGDRDVAAQHRIETGHVPDLRLDGVAHGVGRDHHREDQENGQTRPEQACNGESNAFDAGGGGHELIRFGRQSRGTIATGIGRAILLRSVTLSWPPLGSFRG